MRSNSLRLSVLETCKICEKAYVDHVGEVVGHAHVGVRKVRQEPVGGHERLHLENGEPFDSRDFFFGHLIMGQALKKYKVRLKSFDLQNLRISSRSKLL